MEDVFLKMALDDLCAEPTGADRPRVAMQKQIARYQVAFQRPHLKRGWELWCNVTTHSEDQQVVCDVARLLSSFVREHPELDSPDRDWAYLLYLAAQSFPGPQIPLADLREKLEELARDQSQPE